MWLGVGWLLVVLIEDELELQPTDYNLAISLFLCELCYGTLCDTKYKLLQKYKLLHKV